MNQYHKKKKFQHTVNIIITAGIVIFDDQSVCVQTIRFPFATLFLRLPAVLYVWLLMLPGRLRNWVNGLRRRQRQAHSKLRPTLHALRSTLCANLAYFNQLFFTGGVYWQLVQ